MSARPKPATGTNPVGPWQSTEAAPLFDLDARYSINPGATLPELLSDGHALMSSALGVLQMMDLTDDAEFAVVHLLRQATAVISLADDMAQMQDRASKIGGAA